jgi:hypothetical protein
MQTTTAGKTVNTQPEVFTFVVSVPEEREEDDVNRHHQTTDV